jgi:hypothetical protein
MSEIIPKGSRVICPTAGSQTGLVTDVRHPFGSQQLPSYTVQLDKPYRNSRGLHTEVCGNQSILRIRTV